jgi:hypothetical protein
VIQRDIITSIKLSVAIEGICRKDSYENINISAKESLGYFELKKHKPWFDEGCSKLLDQRKQAKLQWLQDPSEINGDNLNNVRRDTSRHFRNKKKGYQPRNDVVKDENSDLLADSRVF